MPDESGSTHVEVEVCADLVWPPNLDAPMPETYRFVFHGLKYPDPLAAAIDFIGKPGFRASTVDGTIRLRQRTVTISAWDPVCSACGQHACWTTTFVCAESSPAGTVQPPTPDSGVTLDDAERWARGYAARADKERRREVAALLAEYDRRADEIERLRGRTHEIQAQEMTKRAHLDSLIATMRARWDTAKRWTEDSDLRAEWASGEFSAHPWWPMTSTNARDAMARVLGERDEALAQRDAVLALHRRHEAGPDTDVYEWCGTCRKDWPCDTARALGVEA